MAHPQMVLRAPYCHRIEARLQQEQRALFVESATLTLDVVKENRITVSEMYEAGVDIQQMLYAWATYPKPTNLCFDEISKSAVLALHRAMQNKVIQNRFKSFEWFELGLTVADLIHVHDVPVDVLLTFGISASCLVDHDANNYGENWAHYFNWSAADWRALGIHTSAYHDALKRQRVRCSGDARMAAPRTRWGPPPHAQLVSPWSAKRR